VTGRPPHGPKKPLALTAAVLSTALACSRVESGIDPEALGYGPGPHRSLAAGYDPDPVPRPAPTPWTPPDRDGLGEPDQQVPTIAPEPIPHTADVLRVCDRRAALGDPASERDACLHHFRIARVFRSIGDWKTLVSCIEASPDRPTADACERTTPAAVEPIAEYPRESAVCMHLFALLILEEMGAEPMLESEDFAGFEPLVRECVDGLVSETRKNRNPTEYVEVLDCIERAQTSPAAEACESAPTSAVRDMNR
jgi:hypothetical protein